MIGLNFILFIDYL